MHYKEMCKKNQNVNSPALNSDTAVRRVGSSSFNVRDETENPYETEAINLSSSSCNPIPVLQCNANANSASSPFIGNSNGPFVRDVNTVSSSLVNSGLIVSNVNNSCISFGNNINGPMVNNVNTVSSSLVDNGSMVINANRAASASFVNTTSNNSSIATTDASGSLFDNTDVSMLSNINISRTNLPLRKRFTLESNNLLSTSPVSMSKSASVDSASQSPSKSLPFGPKTNKRKRMCSFLVPGKSKIWSGFATPKVKKRNVSFVMKGKLAGKDTKKDLYHGCIQLCTCNEY